MLTKIETGSKHIFRYDYVLNEETCKETCRYLLNKKGYHPVGNPEMFPWEDGDDYEYFNIHNIELKLKLNNHRHLVKNLVMLSFNTITFIEYTHLVIWRANREQNRHKDNGDSLDDNLIHRKFTAITYLNDNFKGGKTFIETENNNQYLNNPKKGSVIIFPSDESAYHGVTKVEAGIRITMPMWFCTNFDNSEEKKYYLKNLS